MFETLIGRFRRNRGITFYADRLMKCCVTGRLYFDFEKMHLLNLTEDEFTFKSLPSKGPIVFVQSGKSEVILPNGETKIIDTCDTKGEIAFPIMKHKSGGPTYTEPIGLYQEFLKEYSSKAFE